MKNSRTVSSFIIALVLGAGAGCSSEHAPMEPASASVDTTGAAVDLGAPDAALLGGLLGGVTEAIGTVTGTVDGVLATTATGLIACDVKETTYGSEWVGPYGGVVRVGPHTLVIPRGALSSYTRIRGTAPKGSTVLVDFEPHGLTFKQPTALTLSYRDCGLTGSLLGSVLLDVVYVNDSQRVLEILPSLNNLLARTVTGRVDHFSGYALADRKEKTGDAQIEGGF